ncbi:hypothetical protein LINPERPRIM_LOCUS32869 [Linum perenne]
MTMRRLLEAPMLSTFGLLRSALATPSFLV